jgi:protein-tyrosine phosphatase
MTTKTIPIFLPGDHVAWVTAGPTRELPDDLMLVRCASEIPVPAERVLFDIGTEDFRPFSYLKLADNLPALMHALMQGERLYVGCMGGTGRTGTLLAILAAQHPQMTGEQAIEYIRTVYKRGAVETKVQEEQVSVFEDFWRDHMEAEGRAYREVALGEVPPKGGERREDLYRHTHVHRGGWLSSLWATLRRAFGVSRG